MQLALRAADTSGVGGRVSAQTKPKAIAARKPTAARVGSQAISGLLSVRQSGRVRTG
jgi:hypothetical protein